MNLGLDFAVGAKLAQREITGDWYRDPWGWPEFAWLETHADSLDIDDFILKTRDGFTLRTQAEFHLIEVPKNRLSARPAVVQDVPSRLVYLAAVATKADSLHATLPDWVYGWRFRNGSGLGDNRQEWPAYLASLQETFEGEWGLQADITSFFSSVDLGRLETLVLDAYGRTASAQLIIDIVRSHDKLSTRSGLPQRSFASAALAHLYLAPLDDAMADAMQAGRVRLAARWMDDINVVGPENELYQLHIRLQERGRQLGLELNPSKSLLAKAEDLKSFVNLQDLKEIALPIKVNVGYDESPFEPDPELLLEFESRILIGEITHPTFVRAVLRSLRENRLVEKYEDWTVVAHKMPHLAEPLSLYLRTAALSIDDSDSFGSGAWDFLSRWLSEQRKQGWTALDFVDAQYSLIFLSETAGPQEVENLRAWLARSPNLQKVAIAAQRLAAIDPTGCRDAIRSRIDHVTDSLMQRALALGLLNAGGDQRAAKDILSRDRRNSLLVQALESRNWAPYEPASDFDSDDSEP